MDELCGVDAGAGVGEPEARVGEDGGHGGEDLQGAGRVDEVQGAWVERVLAEADAQGVEGDVARGDELAHRGDGEGEEAFGV